MVNTDFIRGIIPALVTPMTKDGLLDEKGLEKLLNYAIEAGVDGVFVVGTAGEFWALSLEEKERLFRWAVAYADGRVPVYAGTCANTTREAVALAQIAERSGVDCLSVLTPIFIAPSTDEMFDHYRAIAESVDLPILLYTNPDRTGNALSVDLVVRLAEEVEHIAGIKDSAGDMTLTAEYLRRTPADFRVLMGRDTLIYAGLTHGAVGAIAASANMVPEIGVSIFDHFSTGQLDEALKAQRSLAPLRLAFGLGTFPAMLKAGAELIGLPVGAPRPPVGRLTEKDRLELARVLESMGKIDADHQPLITPGNRLQLN